MLTHTTPTTPSSTYRKPLAMMTAAMPRVAGYVRVSTDMQAEFGLSLEAQEAEIRRYCMERGYELAEVYTDGGYSAKNTDRPAFKRMIADIRANPDSLAAIIVTKLDRLTRSLRDICTINEDVLEPYKVNLVAIRDGINTFEPVSKMLLPFLAVIGQIERQNTSERVKATIKHIHDQGGHYGKVPFGKQAVKEGRLTRLVDHPEEAPWLAQIFEWYKSGVMHTEIAHRLNAAGVKPRSAPAWSVNSVYELLCKHGVHKPRSVTSDLVYDKPRAYRMAYELRADERSMGFIAERLTAAGLRPKNAPRYMVTSVQDLLRSAVYHDRATPRGYALYLREQGCSLREIATRLLEAGHKPKRGGQWHAHQVKLLMAS